MLCLWGCALEQGQRTPARQQLFLGEYGANQHGRKTLVDRVVETDPGSIRVWVKPAAALDRPLRLAVLPFVDRGSGNYILNKLPLTHRDPQALAQWRWTSANRLRRLMHGFLSQRQFDMVPLPEVNAALAAHGVATDLDLARVPPPKLGQWLDADAVVYGEVTHYEAYYLFLLAGWQVTLRIAIVATRDGAELLRGRSTRYMVALEPAVSLIDIGIHSAIDLEDLRDVRLRRAEEEAARELVMRIPQTPLPGVGAAETSEDAPAGQSSMGTPDAAAGREKRQALPAASALATASTTRRQPALPAENRGPPQGRPAAAPPHRVAAAADLNYGVPGRPPQRFFVREFAVRRHGRKNLLDRLLETDPATFTAHTSQEYCRALPQRLAVLPFWYDGSGNLIVNRLPLTWRDSAQRERWRWTYANRMRRVLTSFLAQRGFAMAPLPRIDAALAAHNVKTIAQLLAVPPPLLGRWLRADALVYGELERYEGLYAFLVAGWHIKARLTLVSARDGRRLAEFGGGRFAIGVQPAVVPTDIIIGSGLSLLELRDIRLRRAEEEVAREMMLRLPVCPKAPDG